MAKFEDIITNRRERNLSQVAFQKGELTPFSQVRPGHFYSFTVSPQFNLNSNLIPSTYDQWFKEQDSYVTEKQYYDLNPIGLFLYHENWRELALVINLKVIPPVHRAKLLAGFYFIAEKYINSLYKDEKLIPFNERERLLAPFYGITGAMLQQITNLNLNYSINKYRTEDLRNIRLLDWNNFGELPFANIDENGLMYAPNHSLDDIFEIFEEKQ